MLPAPQFGMTPSRVALAAISMWAVASATTLEKLSLEEMTAKSTDIVRAKVTSANVAQVGSIFYTRIKLDVIERWKGVSAGPVEVSIPGGTINGLRQIFNGAPSVAAGSEYVFFLWRGRSGMVQIIGLSQGLLDVRPNEAGKLSASRAASTERVVAPGSGQVVSDDRFTMGLDELRAFVKVRAGEGN